MYINKLIMRIVKGSIVKTSTAEMLKGRIMPTNPKTTVMVITLSPMMFPKEMSCSLFLIANSETGTSRTMQPTAIIRKPA